MRTFISSEGLLRRGVSKEIYGMHSAADELYFMYKDMIVK